MSEVFRHTAWGILPCQTITTAWPPCMARPFRWR